MRKFSIIAEEIPELDLRLIKSITFFENNECAFGQDHSFYQNVPALTFNAERLNSDMIKLTTHGHGEKVDEHGYAYGNGAIFIFKKHLQDAVERNWCIIK